MYKVFSGEKRNASCVQDARCLKVKKMKCPEAERGEITG